MGLVFDPVVILASFGWLAYSIAKKYGPNAATLGVAILLIAGATMLCKYRIDYNKQIIQDATEEECK